MKKIIFDIDETICYTEPFGTYSQSTPNLEMIAKINEYYAQGFTICFYTSRNMRTYDGNIGKINKHTLPVILKWLEEHNVLYHEIIVGKPWCENGFYVDDRNIRPNEFLSKSYEEILLFLSANINKRKELLNKMSHYIYNSDRDDDISVLFSGWNKEEIEKLEEEIKEKNSDFSKIENYSVRDIFRFLLGTL
jgi:capsule biosynthesis phosphatase